MRHYFSIFLLISVLTASLSFSAPVYASVTQGDQAIKTNIDRAGLSHNLSIRAFDPTIEVGIPAGRLKTPAQIIVTKLAETTNAPTGLTLASPLYQIDMPASAYVAGVYYLALPSSGSNAYKQVYWYDRPALMWKPLPTTENFSKGILSATLQQPFVRLAVFENKAKIVKGDASWYRYKGGLFAASPDFPIGTRLRVINTVNQKSVDVTVNDHGPNRQAHPTRVVDLDAVAFERLAPLGQGTMRVAVEELLTTASVAPATPAPLNETPLKPGELRVGAKAAVLLNSADNSVLWSKNPDAAMPLASLTKLVAIKTFLATKPDLKRVVAYSVKDEQMNAKYVAPGESARLRLKDGDTLPIKDFVYSSLVGSTNNTVETLVRVSGLSRPAFMKKMNAMVADWGATKTYFVEPTGLSPQNVTTAREYAIISRQVFLDPLIANATILPSYSLKTVNTKQPHSFKNTNLLARDTASSLLGSKTGYIDEAGYCLVTKWPTSKNKNVIAVVLGAGTRQQSVDDTKKLLDFANKNIK